jgi:hypothetical protein
MNTHPVSLLDLKNLFIRLLLAFRFLSLYSFYNSHRHGAPFIIQGAHTPRRDRWCYEQPIVERI